MNNKLTSIFISTLLLLPIASATFLLSIFAFEESGYLDSVKLSGKKSSGGEVEAMSRELNDPGSRLYCTKDSTGSHVSWEYEPDRCDSPALFAGVTKIDFDNPTKDPRPLNVTIEDTIMQVRTSLSRGGELSRQCSIIVTGAGDTFWYLGWGLNVGHGPVDIVCWNSTVGDQA